MHPKEGGGGELRERARGARQREREREGGNVLHELRCNEKKVCVKFMNAEDTERYTRFFSDAD